MLLTIALKQTCYILFVYTTIESRFARKEDVYPYHILSKYFFYT